MTPPLPEADALAVERARRAQIREQERKRVKDRLAEEALELRLAWAAGFGARSGNQKKVR